jgi:putative nucleotidyltransferase with HDIG domain
MTRDQAWQLLLEYISDPNLRRHMMAVEVAMRHYARKLDGDEERWGVVGLIHDFDWEIHPTLEDHPLKGAEILRERGVDEAIIRPILSHNTAGTGVEREEPIDFALLACDEVTGLITAATLVRPNKDIRDLKTKSVKKKWKDRSFAAGVDREHVEAATTDFSNACFNGELDLWTHVDHVIEAMQAHAGELELDGRLAEESA